LLVGRTSLCRRRPQSQAFGVAASESRADDHHVIDALTWVWIGPDRFTLSCLFAEPANTPRSAGHLRFL